MPNNLVATRCTQSVVIAGIANSRPIPSNPNRVFLQLENTGATYVLMRFGNEVQFDGGDTVIKAGERIIYELNPPMDAINFSATAPTTVSVIEGIPVT